MVFMELNLYRVQLERVFVQRACDQVLPEKRALSIEGRQRGMLLRDGQRWDFVYMSVLRDEWMAMNNDQ